MDDRASNSETEVNGDGVAIDHATGDAAPAGAAAKLLAAIQRWQRQQPAPLAVAIDGRGAAGKTTLAAAVAALLPATVVHTDDFFLLPQAVTTGERGVGRGSRPAGAAAGAAPHPQIADYYDLTRLRREALAPLSAGHGARYRAHDQSRPGEAPREITLEPAAVILVEGVGACADPLTDLIDRRVLVQVPDAERLARLRRLVEPERWDEAWLAAESHYFAILGERFDLIIGSTSVEVAES
jgi:hypothetical protein